MIRPAGRPGKYAPGAKRTPFVLLLGGLVVGGLCALLALNTASAANEVQRHDLALRDQDIAARVVQLRNDQQASAAPANLARAAEALGMVPAGNPGFLEIGSKGRVRLAGQAAPATEAPLPVPSPAPTQSAAQHKTKKKSKDSKSKDSKSKDSKSKNAKPKNAKSKKTTSPHNADKKDTEQSTKSTKKSSKKTTKHHHGKHRAQSHHERRAEAPTTTITMPGGPR